MRDTLGVIAGPAALSRGPLLLDLCQSQTYNLQLLRLARGVLETARGAKAVCLETRKGGGGVETHFDGSIGKA